MTLRRALLGLLPFTAPLMLFGACANQEVSLGIIMRAPQGVLDNATALELRVIDAESASCDPALGQVTGTTSGDDVLSFPMENSGCSGGALWCKEISLDQDGDERVFYVLASAGNAPLAQGCTTAAVDKDPLDISIQMRRYLPPRCCGNGVPEPTEQCDTMQTAPTDCAGNPPQPGNEACVGIVPDEVCECDCLAKEVLMSVVNTSPNMNNDPGTKSELALAFAGGSGNVGTGLRAVYTDRSGSSTSTPDINISYRNGSLYPIGNATLDKQLRLSECSAPQKQSGTAREQKQPAIAQTSSNIAAVVYASDQMVVGTFEIFLSAQRDSGCADEVPLKINAEIQSSAEAPAIAAGPTPGTALIVWADGGSLRGRIWNEDGTLTPESNDTNIGSLIAGTRPRLASHPNGWLVAYQGTGDDIYYRTISTTAEIGPEVRVNLVTEGLQDQPDIASLPDGRFAVTWNNLGQILFQRYDTAQAPLQGDQDQGASVNSPDGFQPAIAGSPDQGGFFATAWATADGAVWSRLLGASGGFMFNSVTGQNDDYLASHPAIVGQRSAPAVAIGGDGFVVIGWQDNSNNFSAGIQVRRFPLPEPL